MRRVAAVLLLLAAATGCNRGGARRIGMIPKGRAHIFWQAIHAGAAKAARENGVQLIWNGPVSESDIDGQLQIIDAMINQRVDALAVAPIDRTSLVSGLERAAREKIPTVIFDSPADTQAFVAQVATDNYRAGQLAGERMIQILNGKGKVAIVAVQVGVASTMAREKGFEDKIREKAPNIQILDKRYGNADFAQSMTVAENMLTAHPDLDAFFASNESSAVGASQALRTRGSKVKLVGFDAGPSLLEDLKNGVIDSLIAQDPFRMGFEAITAAVSKLNGGTPQRVQNIDPVVVTKENMSDPAIASRIHPDLSGI